VSVDPLGMTAPDAFAKTANADTRAELEKALATYDAKQKAAAAPVASTAAPVHTQEMNSVPAQVSPMVSPKAASHVVPKQAQPKTAAMPASAHRIPTAQPSAPSPSVVAAQGSSPQARIPLAPGSSGGLPAIGPSGPPAASMQGGPRLSPIPMPQPIRPSVPSLVPGLAVSVTWANGQRYRGTIVQLMGGRVLVVFPDGQQHWVEVGYISPA
jgi:hypothetical protein